MSSKQLLTSSSRSVKGALYGSLRRVGTIGKKASRSKSVSNLQALFNPIDDSALSLSTPAAVVPPPLAKENSEASLKPSLSSSSKNPVAPVDGDCPLSPLSPNSQKKRRANYGGVKFNPSGAENGTPLAKKYAVEQPVDSPARVASSPCIKKQRDAVNAKPRTPKRRKSSEMRIYSDKGNNMVAETPGFRFEFGRVDTVPRVELEAVQSAPYRELFVGKPHQNWIALDDTNSAVLVSILKDKAVEGADENVIRAIVRTAEGDSFVTHGALSAAIANKARIRKISTKDLVKRIFQCELRNLRKIKDTKLIDELLKFEDREVVRNYKFGVVYVADGQTKEEDIFANDAPSERFQEFLSVMGDTIDLHGWPNYSGGLDTSSNLTGAKSVFTNWRDHNVMFHVAPMLPTDPKDPQRLEKKRHVGNDVIVIAFVDSNDTAFEPGNFRSHFNHIFVVVRPEMAAGEPMYRIALASKAGVPGFGPELPSPALFAAPQLREFLLCKLINGERAVLQSAPAFAPRLNGARKETLLNYYKQFKVTAM